MPTFAEKLRQLREKAGQTQEQFAEASGVNLWTIRGYEQGRREPNWKVAIALAKALGVPMETFADCSSVEEPGGTKAGKPAPKKPRGRPRKGK